MGKQCKIVSKQELKAGPTFILGVTYVETQPVPGASKRVSQATFDRVQLGETHDEDDLT